MLCIVNTQYGTGVTLWGDYQDFTAIRKVINALLDNCPFNEDVKQTVLALSFDLRKADENQNDHDTFDIDSLDRVEYKGVKVLWPILMFQLKVLREAAKYQPTTKAQHAILYLLESCVETALQQFEPFIGKRCVDWLNGSFCPTPNYLPLILDWQLNNYVSRVGGKARFKCLPDILDSLDACSVVYRNFEAESTAIAKEQGGDVWDLMDLGDMPDFEW